MHFWLTLFALVPAQATPHQAQEPEPFRIEHLTPPGQRAFRFLENLEYFHDGSSDAAGCAPDPVRAMRWLWDEERAAEAFYALLERDSRASELYGLVGLYYADHEEFEREVAFARNLRALVSLRSSSTHEKYASVAHLVERRDGVVVRLDHRQQTVREWAQAHGEQESGYQLDIVGGGTPCLYRHAGGFREALRLPLPPAPEDDLEFTPDRLTENGRIAFELVLEAARFTNDTIGKTGKPHVEVNAMRWLWKEPEAAHAFHAILRHPQASEEGKLFALCGLYDTHPRCFFEELAVQVATNATVAFQGGCLVSAKHSATELLKSHRPGAVRLAPQQTVKQWAAENPSAQGLHCDIFGGGYTNLFRAGGGFHAPQVVEPSSPAPAGHF